MFFFGLAMTVGMDGIDLEIGELELWSLFCVFARVFVLGLVLVVEVVDLLMLPLI